jgi:hypothetical protein
MSSSLSYLTSLFSSVSGSSDPILSALYGGGSGTSSADPVSSLTSAQSNETQDVKVTAAEPAVQLAVANFTKAVNSATSVTQLLSNPSVMNVLLTANGMSDQVGYSALATQALTSNLSDPNSLANQLTDSRWLDLAKTYNFASNGLSAIQNPTAIAQISQAYAQQTWMSNEDTVTPGLSNALSFIQQASSITSVDGVLGNSTVRTVVTTALGIPQQIAFQPLEAQQNAISTHLDVTKLQDPKFVQSLAEQYLIANQQNTSSSSGTDLTSLAVQAGGILV